MELPYRSLLTALADDPEPIVAEVVADVTGPGDDAAVIESLVRPAVTSLLAGLASAAELSAADQTRFRNEGVDAARRGEGVAAPIDRYLSAGWAIWDVATRHSTADPVSLAALGSALLKAGDAAAAAIAEGHGEAERELARRTGAARRAFADDLLDLVPGDPEALARVTRQAVGLGVDADGRHAVVVAWLGREIGDGGSEAERIERAVARPARGVEVARGRSNPHGAALPVVSSRRGRLVLVVPESGAVTAIVALLADLADGQVWAAVRGESVDGLERIAAAAADALAALAIVERVGPFSTVVMAEVVALERALLADRVRLAAAVERELGPLLAAPRVGATLVDTAAAWLASRQNVRATARALGVAPRTVTYRLGRIEALLGRRMDGPTTMRLATALLARELLESTP